MIWHAESINALDPETGQGVLDGPARGRNFEMSIMTPRQDGDTSSPAATAATGVVLKLAADKPDGQGASGAGKKTNRPSTRST